MPAATVIVPSAFIVSPAFGLVPGVSVTLVPITADALFNVSFTITEAVLPPLAPTIGPSVSFTASIGSGDTGIGGTVELLLPGVGSVAPAGTATMAVFALIVVGVTAGAVPDTTKVTELPAPAAMSTVAATFPFPLAAPQLALPALTQVQVTPAKSAGTVSVTDDAASAEGPLLVTTSW